jgi:hypothetical protein
MASGVRASACTSKGIIGVKPCGPSTNTAAGFTPANRACNCQALAGL